MVGGGGSVGTGSEVDVACGLGARVDAGRSVGTALGVAVGSQATATTIETKIIPKRLQVCFMMSPPRPNYQSFGPVLPNMAEEMAILFPLIGCQADERAVAAGCLSVGIVLT